jgi:CheY-like chemotaxis protein
MLSRKLSINTSTVSTSKQRIKEKSLIQKKYLPDFLNTETGRVVIAHGKYRFQVQEEIQRNIVSFVTSPAIPFLILSDNISWLVIGKETSTNNHIPDDLLSSLSRGFIKDMTFDINKIWYDVNETKVLRYFDFSPLLCKTLKVNLPQKSHIKGSLYYPDKFRKNEKLVFKSLTSDSDSSDFKRSKNLDISHPVVTKIKKSFIDQGAIRSVINPNLNAIGFSTLAWFHIILKEKKIEKCKMAQLCNYPNNILSIHDSSNIFFISIYHDMQDLMLGQKMVNDFMCDAVISYEDIRFNYFSLEQPAFNLELNPEPTATSLLGNNIEEKDLCLYDPKQQLLKILKTFFSDGEINSILNDINGNQNLIDTKRDTSDITMNIILDLLTETSYLNSLESKRRASIQAKLIELLNQIQLRNENYGQSNDRIERKGVMIVEDSTAMVETLKDMLIESNFKVVGVVDNGQDAFNLYKDLCERNNKPEVILMDVFINGLDGIEATKMIKNYDQNSCVMVLTSSLDRKLKAKMMSLKVDEYLIKPVTRTKLINCIEQTSMKKRGVIT